MANRKIMLAGLIVLLPELRDALLCAVIGEYLCVRYDYILSLQNFSCPIIFASFCPAFKFLFFSF